MTQIRPNPDDLLAQVSQQEAKQHRGKLKVFFGMSAGVGKTYAMLEEARKRAGEGLDVLIGYAEPHIRTETEALLLGMELLPYKIVEYRGAQLKEFDLDAALKRKPALICVDELAHTNAPGMRHEKRWQDVAELLDAGINVYTTLNVQHIESVNDVVERITGVKVRETLPDAVLEQADDVELVDISPEELLERFREGKVYRPDQAERAMKHFFNKGNLIALRELALRTTAQRVDAQMQDFRREHAVRTTWPATDRLLVCVGPSPLSARLVRATKRLASGLKAEWIAANVETPGSVRLSDRDRRRIEQTLRLAEQLGAQTITLRGTNVADEVITYARSQNVTKVVIGKPLRSRWREIVFGSVVDDLVRRSGEIDIYVIRGETEEAQASPPASSHKRRADVKGYAWAAGITAVVSALGWVLHPDIGQENVLMMYLLGVLWVATQHSRRAAILMSLLSVLAFDLFFVPPHFYLTVHDQKYLITFAVMLITALTISTLAHRIRTQADAARRRERQTHTLLALSRAISAAGSVQDIASATIRHISDVTASRTVLLLPDDQRMEVKADTAGQAAMSATELGAARWAFEHQQPAGATTATLPSARGLYLPMNTSAGAIGVLGIFVSPGAMGLQAEQRQLVDALASQAALAIERTTLSQESRLDITSTSPSPPAPSR